MKKIIVIAYFVMLLTASSFAQRVVMANYTDTITNAQTKYYPAAVQPALTYGAFQCWVDHITGSTDSTYVMLQGSMDNSVWITLSSTLYANTIISTAAAPTDFKTFRMTTTDAGMTWNISTPLLLPYYRYAVTHYATGTVRFLGYLYKKK
jgi:hypothetical protein